jgi:hypothetical protein
MRTAHQIDADSQNMGFRERYQQTQIKDLPAAKNFDFFESD